MTHLIATKNGNKWYVEIVFKYETENEKDVMKSIQSKDLTITRKDSNVIIAESEEK